MLNFNCWFRHKKLRYVGINDVLMQDPYPHHCLHGTQFRSSCGTCAGSSQVATWVCDTCGMMGTTFVKRGTGIYKIYMGGLIPDEKAWGEYAAVEK